MKQPLDHLISELRNFRDARDWGQFHSPRNLIEAISIEAGELLELVQWKTESEFSNNIKEDEMRRRIEEESADVFTYLLLLADRVGFDLIAATQRKLTINNEKYPINKAKGTAKKYTEL